MKLLTTSEVNGIVRSVKSVFAHDDIGKLTKPAYKFLYLSYSFIAHYNLHGFRFQYQYVPDLAEKIIQNQAMNQWDNFRRGERDYEYYMQKKQIYNQLVELSKLYLSKKMAEIEK